MKTHLPLRTLAWLSLAVVTFTAVHARASDRGDGDHLRLVLLGEQRALEIPALQRYALGGTCIHVGRPPGKAGKLLIRGVKAGVCDLKVQAREEDWNTLHFEVVAPVGEGTRDARLLAALAHLEEVEAIPSGSRWILRGSLTTQAEALRVRLLTEGWPEAIHSEVDVDSELAHTGELHLRQWIAQQHLDSSLDLHASSEGLVVEGTAPDEATRGRWITGLQKAFALVDTRIEALKEGGRSLHLQAYLVSIKRDDVRALGLDWREGPTSLLHATLSGLQSELELVSNLKALESHGAAQILSNPQLVMRVPGEAELFAGAELPFEEKNHYTYQILWRNFGLTLKIKALEATAKEARLAIEAEMSHLDEQLKLRDLPGLQSNRMKTTVDAPFGKPILLSGLIQDEQRESRNGLPFLSQIPLLGLLFGAESSRSGHAELVAILLPERGIASVSKRAIHRVFPRGTLPWPRLETTDLTDAPDTAALRESPDFPWSALQ